MKSFEDSVNLLFAVRQLFVFHECQFLELEECFKNDSDLLLDDGCKSRVVIDHKSHYLDKAAQSLARRQLRHETIWSKNLLFLLESKQFNQLTVDTSKDLLELPFCVLSQFNNRFLRTHFLFFSDDFRLRCGVLMVRAESELSRMLLKYLELWQWLLELPSE